MDHITVNGQVVPVPSNWSDEQIAHFAAGIKANPDHITVAGKAYAVPSSWTDKSINDYGAALKSGLSAPAQPSPASDNEGFIHATLRKTAQKMNVQNMLDLVGQVDTQAGRGDWAGAWDTIKNLPVGMAKGLYNDVAHGSASDTLSDILSLAPMVEGVTRGGISGAATDAASGAADAAGKYGARIAENTPAAARAVGMVAKDAVGAGGKGGNVATALLSTGLGVAGHPVMGGGALLFKAAANVLKGGNLSDAASAIADILRKPTAKEIFDATSNRKPVWDNQVQTAPPEGAPVTPVDAPGFNSDGTYTLPSGRVIKQVKPVSTDISTNVQISPKISVRAASSAEGTSPASGNTLDLPTTQRLAKAARDGTAAGLPAGAKGQLTQAVRNGDNSTVQDILDNHTQLRTGNGRVEHASLDIHQTDIQNKVAVIARYLKDHSIDPESINPADYDDIAKQALAHAKNIDELVTPRSGRYRPSRDNGTLISDATMALIRGSLKK